MAVATALSSNILVIKVGRNPAGGTMTVIALCRGRQMIQVLARTWKWSTVTAGSHKLVL